LVGSHRSLDLQRTEMDAAFAEEDEELSTDDSLKLVLQRLER
jgi:hypothetical protein